jgi:hypothetical protein
MRKLATVRRFNFGNGHGFVKTDAGDADVFLFTPDQLRANGRRGGLAYVATILSNSGGHISGSSIGALASNPRATRTVRSLARTGLVTGAWSLVALPVRLHCLCR